MKIEPGAWLTRLCQEPLLLAPQGANHFASCVAALAAHEHAEEMVVETTSRAAIEPDEDFFGADQWGRPYVVTNGILQIPVMGALINRFTRQLGTYATGYQYIERALERGLNDFAVKGIALVVHSTGGEAAGCFELTDKIYSARGVKPIRAYAADQAYSAAYAIASAADEVVITRSGGAGSVGVVSMHVSFEQMLTNFGLEVTFIYAGKHKKDGNSFEKLAPGVKDWWQMRVDRLYGEFAETVARNREMSEDAVRDTEALIYDAKDSVQIGFADRQGELQEEMIAFSTAVDIGNREDEMNAKTETIKTETPGLTQADVDKASAQAADDARKAERERYSAVTSHAVYKGREALATQLLTTEMSAEQIVAALEVAAPAVEAKEPAGGASHFQKHMDTETHPGIEATTGGGGTEGQEDTSEARASAILKDYASAGGAVIKPN